MRLTIPRVEVKRYKYSEIDLVPRKFDDFLTDMNYICASNKTDFFHGREKEIERIFTAFMLTNCNNALLVGERGVGKKSIVQSAVNQVLKENCPRELEVLHFFSLNIEKIIAIVSSDDRRANKQVVQLFEYLSTEEDVILVIDQIHLMLQSSYLAYNLSNLLRMPNIRILGITTEEDLEDFWVLAPDLLTMVNIIPVQEPNLNKIYSMISEYIGILAQIHGIAISEDVIDYGISLSHIIPSEQCNPGKITHAIEKAMVIAKEKKHQSVTREDFNFNLNLDYEFFNSMSDEDKKITAYHETGHFLVTKMSENIRDIKTTAITIVPSEIGDFLGVTLHTREMEKQISHNTDYLIDQIAYYLGGRVAEEILLGEEAKPTTGASSDLIYATQTARAIVTEFGMIDSYGKNMTSFCNYDLSDLALLSEENKQMIARETHSLIEKAYDRAKAILTQNKELLELIAQKLIENQILDEKDLDSLCSQVINN